MSAGKGLSPGFAHGLECFAEKLTAAKPRGKDWNLGPGEAPSPALFTLHQMRCHTPCLWHPGPELWAGTGIGDRHPASFILPAATQSTAGITESLS